jgi:hypothetical protein
MTGTVRQRSAFLVKMVLFSDFNYCAPAVELSKDESVVRVIRGDSICFNP